MRPYPKFVKENAQKSNIARKNRTKKRTGFTADALADYAIKSVFLFFFLLGGLVCPVGNAQFTHGRQSESQRPGKMAAIVRAEAAAPAASLFSFLPSLAGETMLMVA